VQDGLKMGYRYSELLLKNFVYNLPLFLPNFQFTKAILILISNISLFGLQVLSYRFVCEIVGYQFHIILLYIIVDGLPTLYMLHVVYMWYQLTIL
jgi:hypothetical protein